MKLFMYILLLGLFKFTLSKILLKNFNLYFYFIIFSTVDLWKTKIVASHNFWNYNETLAVGGRIRDRTGKCLWSIIILIIKNFINNLITII